MFLVKLISQWIPNGNGRGIARDIKKNIFNFKTRQKMVTKLGQFKKLGSFSKFQLFLISQAIPRPSPSGIYYQSILPKKCRFCIFSNKKKNAKLTCKERSQKNLSLFLFFLKICWNINFLVKLIGQWIPNGDGWGIARDIQKK